MASLDEQQYLLDLEYARLQDQANRETEDIVQEVKHPSKFKYRTLFILALTLDILDFAELTGVGVVLTYALKFLFAPILFMYGIHAGSRVKNMSAIAQTLEEKISHVRKRAYTYARRYQIAVGAARRIGLGKVAHRAQATERKINQLGKGVLRNPALKNTILNILDFIPLFDLLTLRTLGVYLTYRDEKKTYEETLPVVVEYQEAREAEIETAAEEESAELEAAEVQATSEEDGKLPLAV